MTTAYQGIGIHSSGAIALGPAYLDTRCFRGAPHTLIEAEEVSEEIARFDRAVIAARHSLKSIRQQIPADTRRNIAEFIDTHLLMLEDTGLIDEVRLLIGEQLCNAEWALQLQCDALVRLFDEMDDPYLRTRRNDIEHVVSQIQSFLRNSEGQTLAQDLGGRVIVARSISPADTILLHYRGAIAFVSECGGPMSHSAILARSLGIPAVIGVHNITQYIQQGESVVVDAETGTVLTDAAPHILEYFRKRRLALEERQRQLRRLLGRPACSRDGVTIHLEANLELPEDVDTTLHSGAEGVGLYRTEFLYMNRNDLPDEEEQYATYCRMIRSLRGLPLTIRTLDLGADKVSHLLTGEEPQVCNPALGLRAIRFCLKEPAILRPQLRAILRAAATGPVRMLVPMLSNLSEITTMRALIHQAACELDAAGLPHDGGIPLGGMIEVPAAALCARTLAQQLDFLSIGTNDLIQYTLAIDRQDNSVNYLYDPMHPAILQLIRLTIAAGRAARIPVGMCGEMAGDARYTRLLLGLGLRSFSMQPGAILDVKEIVCASDIQALERRTEDWLRQLEIRPVSPPRDLLPPF